MPILRIYHGSKDAIEKPIFGYGKKTNDFGLGFYCTKDINMANEWAVSSIEDGYSNKYEIDTSYLKILNINSEKYTILNWIALLVQNRIFELKTPIARRAREYLIDNFSINVNAYDIVIGYRADDAYFDYAEAFLNNSISVNQLALAMKLGKLGEQIVIKSQYAFSLLKYKGSIKVKSSDYYDLRKKRNDEANKKYLEILEKDDNGLYIRDIINGGVKNGDSRIPRNIP